MNVANDLRAHRSRLYEWLCTCLMGPGSEVASDQHDLNGITPLDRYTIGILFPVVKGSAGGVIANFPKLMAS